MSELSKYLNEVGDLPPEVLLGRIVLFTISDEAVPREHLEQWFAELDLNEGMLPPQIKPIDAFKKATSDAKGNYMLSGNREAFTLCRDVTSTTDYLRRQITREIRDSAKKRLSYDEAITCTFYRSTPGSKSGGRVSLQIQWDKILREEEEDIKRLANQIKEDYERYANKLDGNKLRAVVRKYLEEQLNAIMIKGGVYFVHARRDDELTRLSTLVDKFGGDCRMNTIPMVNIERERKFIAEQFEREASKSLSELAKEAKEMIEKRKSVTPAMYAKMKGRLDTLLERAKEHITVLEVSQDLTSASAEVARQALHELQLQMLEGAA